MKKEIGRQSSPEEMGRKIPAGEEDGMDSLGRIPLKYLEKVTKGAGARGNFFESPPTRKATSRLRLLGVARWKPFR